MINNSRIAVVVPCYNEATQIRRVLASMPAEADHIYVIDDASQDDTARIVRECLEKYPRVKLIQLWGQGGIDFPRHEST